MKEFKIKYEGIARSASDQDIANGYLDEAMNVRKRHGKLTTRGHATKLYNKPLDDFSKIYFHDQEGIMNYIGYLADPGEVRLIDMVMGTSELIVSPITGNNVDIVFLKRAMIVISDEGVKVFLYTQDDVYLQTESLPVPDVVLKRTTAAMAGGQATEVTTYAGLLGTYYEGLNKLSNDSGKLYGSMMYIVAYRLFDGSYILPSIPRYIELSNGGNMKWRNPDGGHTDDRKFWFEFYGYNMTATIAGATYFNKFAVMKDLVQSVCVFATKVTPLIQITETSLTDTTLANYYGTKYNSDHGINTWAFSKVFPAFNKEFKELAKSNAWYKIHEFDFEKLVTTPYVIVDPVDTTGYYQDYATRETLTTDQFTHHTLTARDAYVYNDRLHLQNIKTSPGKPYVLWHSPEFEIWINSYLTTYIAVGTTPGKIAVNLKTNLGVCVVVHDVDIPTYRSSGDPMTDFVIIPGVVGYNDSRANKIIITATVNGVNYQLLSQNLVKNKAMNFSFYYNTDFVLSVGAVSGLTNNFSSTMIKVSDITTYLSIPDPVALGLPFDTNRMQVSEIQNPLFFPTKNSYQVGTGSIITVRSRSIPLSTGQFGQYPLQVFTTSGIWAVEQGNGDVLYSNIVPVNGEVALNKDQIISLSFGVTYSTMEGLFMVSGIDVTDLTQLLIGPPNLYLQAEDNYKKRLNHINLVHLDENLSIIDAKQYILGSKVGFDKKNNELIITNSLYNYSYVFSFDSKCWTKISESYDMLINCYPQLLALRKTNYTGVYSLSVETFGGSIDVLLTTRPLKLDGENTFALLHRIIQRCELKVPLMAYCAFYVFASNDLIKWQLFKGSDRRDGNTTDIVLGRVHCKAKYFIFVFASALLTDSAINEVDIQLYHKLGAKIR